MSNPANPEPVATEQRIDAPTPNGGDYSIAYFRDGKGSPCAKVDAAYIEIVEFKADGSQVMRTFMVRKETIPHSRAE